ncbi:hypothetical protein JCM10207_002585 [Rhodosporidiobolus poonsookiae]
MSFLGKRSSPSPGDAPPSSSAVKKTKTTLSAVLAYDEVDLAILSPAELIHAQGHLRALSRFARLPT